MAQQAYKVIIKLVRNQSPCHIGHQIGDEWEFDYMTPGGMCGLAYNALYPTALALQYGATFPWQTGPDTIEQSCPDAGVNNVFELRRVPKS